MAEIDIRQDPQSGQVTLVLNGAPQEERRFRLRDTLTNKYLTKRGWSGKAAYLPGDALVKGDVHEILIEADAAQKITPYATLVLEAPSAAFATNFVWRPKIAEAAAAEFEITEVPDLTPDDVDFSPAVAPDADKPDSALEENLDRKEPEEKSTLPNVDDAREIPLLENIPARRSAIPPVFVALLFLLFGLGAGYALFAGDAETVKPAAQAPAATARNDLETELAEANEKIAALGRELELAKTKAQLPPDQRSEELTAQLDTLKKTLAERESEIEKLKQAQAGQAAPAEIEWQERVRRAEEARDLYSEELQALTANFAELQKEKARLEAAQTTSAGVSRAVWGAAAIDEGGVIYALQNQTVEKAAKDNVNAVCRGKSSYRCVPLSAYKNACLSVARFKGEQPSTQNYGFAVHADWKQAEANALDQCRQRGGTCEVRFTACSPDTLSKPISE